MNSDGSGKFQGTKCGSCGGRVGHRTPEKIREQDQDKGYGICPKCEDATAIYEEKIWDSWRKTVKDSLNPANQKEWDEIEVDVQKAFILQQLDLGNIKIG
tara:strand:+ start:1189 stop:1488 length:300 start_codon:yes stop_codon:yes gene_type:complete